jgi:hypothetical protein
MYRTASGIGSCLVILLLLTGLHACGADAPSGEQDATCIPDCTGRECGDDGCGGSCGTCDDGNPCTDDLCGGMTCVVPLANTAPCDDANICTAGDTCGDKACHSGSPALCTGIDIELTWESPEDPIPNDRGVMAGTDLDLHLTHPNASQEDLDGDGNADPWFDPDWDCWWFYPVQNWGSISSNDDNAVLDREGKDGFCQEIVRIDKPEDGKTYAIGVNYWDDHGFGSALATVRVYVGGVLKYTAEDVALIRHDFWWVGTIDWHSGSVLGKTTAEGGRWVTHDYHHPLFYQP